MPQGKRVILVVAGGIAAYKCLELVRRLKDRGITVRTILTKGGAEFVTPLALGAISGEPVHRELFSVTEENAIGHIQLARDTDLVVVAPATADLLAKMAIGLADDLATAVLLATRAPILIAPAMNPAMWSHAATQANVATLEARGLRRVGPEKGEMAEPNEPGRGRLAEPLAIVAAIEAMLSGGNQPLKGRRALVTSGPTHEAIDPVRYIANRSSGKQGHAIARALARLGARTTLVSGPTSLPDPAGVTVVRVETALEMRKACLAALPADVAVLAAAVADWRVAIPASRKLKKDGGLPALTLAANPDILTELAKLGRRRPTLVVGFAAETENVVANAKKKRLAKGCDWIVANGVAEGSGVFGGEKNRVHLIAGTKTEDWPEMTKDAVADKLAEAIARSFAKPARKARP
ncbi:MAG: bifunctional phosphopantothenoylcysteine decarboxylase/phosphopantothenate--cysteine ligase CoaBC [Rhodospirillales bacterium]|nr:bifunctional phosphopantothenoylcysteine decarboxylase/phosphopantothenate--cysteine ligase CoaBC [Rhodospirillales bacterium]